MASVDCCGLLVVVDIFVWLWVCCGFIVDAYFSGCVCWFGFDGLVVFVFL